MTAEKNLSAEQATEALDTFIMRDDWLGFGYIGERRYLTAEQRTTADAVVVAYAVEHGWNTPELFLWANSKLGRWFGEYATDSQRAEPGALRHIALTHDLFNLPKIRRGI